MASNDLRFAKRLKNVLEFLYKAENPKEKEELYNEGINLINAHFGACPRCGFVNTGGKFCSECGQELMGEVIKENINIESVDYLIATKHGKDMSVLAIVDTEESALTNLRKQLSGGKNVSLFKRTIERVKLN